jgi:DNA polymerase III subunit gamma/tau
MSLAFYRQFRPDKFDKMVGQSPAVGLLAKCARKNEYNHAYMLTGHSGSGKTTAARILAMAVNCTEKKLGEHNPCGKCSSCMSIKEDMAMDIRELDGASNGGKDEIRRIIESALYSPVLMKKKIFIIDEAHELTAGAMTALLKPTEEPNPAVMYILCTSEYHKIPPTVASRCWLVPFLPITDKVVADYLAKLAKHIGAEIEADACMQIALVSGGNMRVAMNYIQSLLLQSDNKLTAANARTLLGLVGRDNLYSLASHIADNRTGAAMDALESIMSTSPSAAMVCRELSEIFRNAMLTAGGATSGITVSSAETSLVADLGNRIGLRRLLGFAARFTECQYSMTINHNQRWVFETLVASLCDKQ